MYSNEGPAYATTDINNDNIADFYLGGAKHQAGRIYISSIDGSYKQITTPFELDAKSEDTDAIFFDAVSFPRFLPMSFEFITKHQCC